MGAPTISMTEVEEVCSSTKWRKRELHTTNVRVRLVQLEVRNLHLWYSKAVILFQTVQKYLLLLCQYRKDPREVSGKPLDLLGFAGSRQVKARKMPGPKTSKEFRKRGKASLARSVSTGLLWSTSSASRAKASTLWRLCFGPGK